MERASGVTKIIFKCFIQPTLCQLNKCFTEILPHLTFFNKFIKKYNTTTEHDQNPADHFKKVKLKETENQ